MSTCTCMCTCMCTCFKWGRDGTVCDHYYTCTFRWEGRLELATLKWRRWRHSLERLPSCWYPSLHSSPRWEQGCCFKIHFKVWWSLPQMVEPSQCTFPKLESFFSVLYSPSIVSFWTVLIMLSPPQGLFMYWLPSSIYSIAQILLLKLPPVKSRLGIPDTITTPSHTKTAASSKGFFQMVKDSKSMTPYLLISTVSGTFF